MRVYTRLAKIYKKFTYLFAMFGILMLGASGSGWNKSNSNTTQVKRVAH